MQSVTTFKITAIIITKVKAIISFENGEKLEMTLDTYTDFYLIIGKELSTIEFKQLQTSANQSRLLSYAYQIISRRSYTEKQMRDKLAAKLATTKQTEEIVKRLITANLINDRRYLEEVLQLAQLRNWGKHKILQRLCDDGLPASLIAQVQFDQANETEKAEELLPKMLKKYQNNNARTKKDKIFQAYLQLGFSLETAKPLLEHTLFTNDDNETLLLVSDLQKARRKYQKETDVFKQRSKVVRWLLQKGYNYEDITRLMEKNDDIN